MTSISTSRRSLWCRAIGIFLLVVLTSLVATPWLLREWHAWQGYRLFLKKEFPEASSHLLHVSDGTTAVAARYGLPSMKHLYAQSLLVTGRTSEAVQQYSALASLDPTDATPALIIALHDAKRGNWESAAAGLERHKASAKCQPCKVAHGMFRSAVVTRPKVAAARREQDAQLAGMARAARCLSYRAGAAAASVLAEQMLVFVEPDMVRHLRASGMTAQATESAVSITGSLIGSVFGKFIESAVQRTLDLDVSCAQRVQLHEMLHLKRIPYVDGIERWVEFKTLEEYIERLPYVRQSKDALTVGVHVRELGAFAVAYAEAFRAESVARAPIQEADAYAAIAWDAIEGFAQNAKFASKEVPPIPSEKSWIERIKRYIWSF